MKTQKTFLKLFAKKANKSKYIFTPGPSSLAWQNIATLSPAFGRNDDVYLNIEMKVMSWLKNLSGQDEIVRLQGSSTTGLEIALENFVSNIEKYCFSDSLLQNLCNFKFARNLFSKALSLS